MASFHAGLLAGFPKETSLKNPRCPSYWTAALRHRQPFAAEIRLLISRAVADMSRQKPKPVILVVSRDPELADVRKIALEKAGFKVVPATNLQAVVTACAEHTIDIAMIGYSLPPAEKRRVENAIKEACKIPILELHQEDGPELLQPMYSHHSRTPDDFVDAVKEVLKKSQ